jgi:glycosyltransferase involved in cell wall biosynthesis
LVKGTLALLIPAYNAAQFLPRLLDSVAKQTRPFDEVWVYDDCSSDETAEIARSFGAKVVRGAVNCGCTRGKSKLANLTGCEWIHFHDADDELLPQFVERAHRWMERNEHDVVVFGSVEREDGTNRFMSQAVYDSDLLSADPVGYTIENKISANAGIYRRSAFLAAGGFDTDPDVLYNEDVAMHCSLARARLRFAADPEIMMINWRRQDSMSMASPARCFRAHFHVMRKAMEHDRDGVYRYKIADRLWDNAASAASVLDWETADACGRLAFRLGGRPRQQSRLFRTMCFLGPRISLRVREWLIRLLKPQYRAKYPGWRLR